MLVVKWYSNGIRLDDYHIHIPLAFMLYQENHGNQKNIKGIVHPKIKILLLITHPHVIPNL